MDVLDRADLPFPHSLPEFQRLFPDDAACAAYLEKARWGDGFACPHCGTAGEPFHFENRPGVLRCRKCRQNTGLTVGTVMERSHTPLNVWFWAAYLVASQTPGMSAVQFQRQLGLSRYETAFQILHKLRSGMVRPNQDRIGGQPKNHVEVDETWVGGRTRGEGRGVHHKVLVSCAIEVRHRKPGTKLDNRKDGRYAGRVRLAVVLDRSAESLCGFVESTVAPGSLIVTDDWSGYAGLGKRGYEHFAVAECGDPEVAEQYLPIIHLVFANLKTWLIGIHHGVSHQHLQAYLRVRPETLCRITEFSEHESNVRELDEGERVAVEVLPVLSQSAAAVEPGDGAFDHPTPGLDDEALHPIGSLDDLGLEIGQDAGQGAVKDRPLIGAVGEQFPEKGKQTEQGRQQRETAVAILNVGGGDDAVQQQALRIDQNMPLLALDQLAGIEAVAVDASPPFSALFTL